MFSSERQLEQQRPTPYCDLSALINVAYYCVYKDTPATRFANSQMKKYPGLKLWQPQEFKPFRLKNRTRFELELMSRQNPFYELASYVFDKRDYNELADKRMLKSLSREGLSSSDSSSRHNALNYEHMISLIPEELGCNKPKRPSSLVQPPRAFKDDD